MFETKHQRLAPKKVYVKRLWKNFFFAFFLLSFSLLIGVLGYYWTVPQFSFYDSFLNASMILSGMGPVMDGVELSNAAKMFASIYALFSGVTFITSIAIVIAPIAHRFFHRFHLDEK